jgi:hypothetical protein
MFEPHHVVEITDSDGKKAAVVICLKCGEVEFFFGPQPSGAWSVLEGPNTELARILSELVVSTPASGKSTG